MAAPSGVSGVHCFPKYLHWPACIFPCIISPAGQINLFLSSIFAVFNEKRFAASNCSYSFLSLSPLSGINPIPCHTLSHDSNTSYIICRAFIFPSFATALRYAFLLVAIPHCSSFRQTYIPSIMSAGSKPVITTGLFIFLERISYSRSPVI